MNLFYLTFAVKIPGVSNKEGRLWKTDIRGRVWEKERQKKAACNILYGLESMDVRKRFQRSNAKKMTRLIKCYTGQEDVAGDDRKKEHDT